LVFDRNGNPVELFSVVAPLFKATQPGNALEPLLHHVGVDGADTQRGLTSGQAIGGLANLLSPWTKEKRGRAGTSTAESPTSTPPATMTS